MTYWNIGWLRGVRHLRDNETSDFEDSAPDNLISISLVGKYIIPLRPRTPPINGYHSSKVREILSQGFTEGKHFPPFGEPIGFFSKEKYWSIGIAFESSNMESTWNQIFKSKDSQRILTGDITFWSLWNQPPQNCKKKTNRHHFFCRSKTSVGWMFFFIEICKTATLRLGGGIFPGTLWPLSKYRSSGPNTGSWKMEKNVAWQMLDIDWR